MKTAVEWFADKIGHNSLMALTEYNDILEQAKAMEKEQIANALQWSHDFGREIGYKHLLYNYYKETYESNT